jgi:hypothetical protein
MHFQRSSHCIMSMSSHVGDGAAGVTWPWRDADAKSCWRQCCRGDLAGTRCRCWVMLGTVLLSHAGDGAVLRTVSVMHWVHTTFETFDDSDQDLAWFVELRIFSQVWSVLSAMVAWHRALACLTRHMEILIHLSCMGIESLRIFRFLLDHARLSALWSRGSWPDYSCMQSCEIQRFWTLIESCIPFSLLSTKCPGCKMLHSSSPTIRSLSQLRW